MPTANLDALPSFTRATLPDARSNTILRDVQIIIEEPSGARGVWISDGTQWVALNEVVTLTSAQIAAPTAAQLAATSLTFQLNVAPYTRYQSNGTILVPIGGGTGTVLKNATDITTSRAVAAADFGTGVIAINSAGVVAITVPTVAAMALASTPGQLRVVAFEVLGGGIPTFAGATASTSINGTAGATTVLPLGGAPVTGGFYTLTQQTVGGDAWTLA